MRAVPAFCQGTLNSPTLAAAKIGELLRPYLADKAEGSDGGREADPELLEKLSAYLDLLVKWNSRMNLTAVRDPAEIVTRHFGESLFAARHVAGKGTLLDLGSGAGFPGLPIQLWHSRLRVTLAESQAKKATFLREVVRSLSLPTEVFAGRAEEILPSQTFDVVVLRAVDRPSDALRTALALSTGDVWLLSSGVSFEASLEAMARARSEVTTVEEFALPAGVRSRLFRMGRQVPHGTG